SASHGDLGPALWGVVTGSALETGRQRQDAWIVDRRDFPNAHFAEGEGCGHQEGGAELGFHHVYWAPPGCTSSELISVRLRIRRHNDLGNVLPRMRGGQVELLVEGEGRSHRGMRAPTTGIGLETDLLATKNSPQIIGQFLQ